MPTPDPQCTCIHVQSDHFNLTGRCQAPDCAARCPKFELGVHVHFKPTGAVDWTVDYAVLEGAKPKPNEN